MKLRPAFCHSCVLQCFSQVEPNFFIDALSNFATALMSQATLPTMSQATLPTTSRFDFHTSGTIYSFVKANFRDVLANLADRKFRFSGFAEL